VDCTKFSTAAAKIPVVRDVFTMLEARRSDIAFWATVRMTIKIVARETKTRRREEPRSRSWKEGVFMVGR
jgi:hypothetical protein